MTISNTYLVNVVDIVPQPQFRMLVPRLVDVIVTLMQVHHLIVLHAERTAPGTVGTCLVFVAKAAAAASEETSRNEKSAEMDCPECVGEQKAFWEPV
jgi:hypothetical protein